MYNVWISVMSVWNNVLRSSSLSGLLMCRWVLLDVYSVFYVQRLISVMLCVHNVVPKVDSVLLMRNWASIHGDKDKYTELFRNGLSAWWSVVQKWYQKLIDQPSA